MCARVLCTLIRAVRVQLLDANIHTMADVRIRRRKRDGTCRRAAGGRGDLERQPSVEREGADRP